MGAMRRSAMLLVGMLALGGALAAGAAATGGSEPKLTIVRAAPLTVRGTGFAAAERVRLTIRGTTRTVVRSVRVGTSGAFTVRFAAFGSGAAAMRRSRPSARVATGRGSSATAVWRPATRPDPGRPGRLATAPTTA